MNRIMLNAFSFECIVNMSQSTNTYCEILLISYAVVAASPAATAAVRSRRGFPVCKASFSNSLLKI